MDRTSIRLPLYLSLLEEKRCLCYNSCLSIPGLLLNPPGQLLYLAEASMTKVSMTPCYSPLLGNRMAACLVGLSSVSWVADCGRSCLRPTVQAVTRMGSGMPYHLSRAWKENACISGAVAPC